MPAKSQGAVRRAAGLDRGHVSPIEPDDLGISTQQKIVADFGASLAELVAQAEEMDRHRKRLGWAGD